MGLHEIRYFLALSETLNFTRAAEHCNVTQPALTRAIKSLEDKLGSTLIHRERGNTHLTDLGLLMLPYFSEMFTKMDEAQRRAQSFIKLDESRLTIGLMCTIGPSKLIDLFADFNASYQGVELYLKDSSSEALEQLLIEGELDVAIYCKPEEPRDELHALPLYTERFMIASAEGHPLSRLSKIRLKDLNGHSYLRRVNCEYRDYIRGFSNELGIDVKRPYSSERDDWIQCMVLAGLGFTLIPEFAVTVPGLVVRELVEPKFVRQINLVTVRGRPHAPAVGAFVHACRRYRWEEKMREAPVQFASVAAQ